MDYGTEAWGGPVLVIGRTDEMVVEKFLSDVPSEVRTTSEAVVYRWAESDDGGLALIAAGSNDRGLMYALLELAEGVEERGIPVSTGWRRPARLPTTTSEASTGP